MKILCGGECLKCLIGGQQLLIDYKTETNLVEKAVFAESGYSIGAMIMNYQTLVGVSIF